MKTPNFNSGGMVMYTQLTALDRRFAAIVAGLQLVGYTVKDGDCWNPDDSDGDKLKHSERTEDRSRTLDIVGDGKWYKYVIPILIPLDYPEFKPKATFAQWHEGEYPVASLRYETGLFEFVTNYSSDVFVRKTLPITKGKLTEIVVYLKLDAGLNAAEIYVFVDGVEVVHLVKHSLVETGTKSVYFKNGIYRSGMDKYTGPKPAPTQTVFFGQVMRQVLDKLDFVPGKAPLVTPPVVTPPIATTPAPVIPTPAAPAASLYARIAALKVSIQSLEPDMSPKYAASIGFLAQAVEKLEKMTAQMEKADAKAK